MAKITGVDKIGYVETCNDCGFKEYRLDYSLVAYSCLQQHLASKGIKSCYRCKKRNTIMKQLKKKDIEALKRKFPNNMVLYTEKTLEELLVLPDGSNYDLVNVLYKAWSEKGVVKEWG